MPLLRPKLRSCIWFTFEDVLVSYTTNIFICLQGGCNGQISQWDECLFPTHQECKVYVNGMLISLHISLSQYIQK